MRSSIAALCALFVAMPSSAHHSHGNYAATFTDVEGVVKEVHLVNPHSWIYVEVRSAGKQAEMWALEATSRVGLDRVGITKNPLKIGERIKARCHPLRDGSSGCLLGFVKRGDGRIENWDGTNLPLPTDL